MDKEVQKINVRIGGMSYNLVSSESEQYTRQVAARADEMIRRVAMSSPQLSQQMTTVLALTNAVDELTRQSLQQSLAEQQRDAAELKTTELRTELAKARELNWELKKELLRLNTLCHQQDARILALEKAALAEREPGPETNMEMDSDSDSDSDTLVPEPANDPETTAETEYSSVPEPLAVPETVAVPESMAAYKPAAVPAPANSALEPPFSVDLRQTGIDEYLSGFAQLQSRVTELEQDDES